MQGGIDTKTNPWPQISEAAKDCVRKLLCRDPSKRPTAAEILQVATRNSAKLEIHAPKESKRPNANCARDT